MSRIGSIRERGFSFLVSQWRSVVFGLALLSAFVGVRTGWGLGVAAATLLGLVCLVPGERTETPQHPTPPAFHPRWKRFMLPAVGAILISLLAAWTDEEISRNLLAAGLWIAAMGILVAASAWHDGARPSLRAAFHRLRRDADLRRDLAIAGLITLLALFLRLWRLETLPYFHGDEGEFGLLALNVLQGDHPWRLFDLGWYGLPNLFNFFQAGSLAVFGNTVFGLRMTSVLLGTAVIPLVYWIGRLQWGRFAAATAAWLLAVSHLEIQYGRLGTIFPTSFLCMVLVILLLTRDRQQVVSGGQPAGKKILHFVAAGLVIGISQYTYYAARLIPFVAAALLLFLCLEKKASARQVLALVIAALAVLIPLGWFYTKQPGLIFARMNTVSALNQPGFESTLGPGAKFPEDLLLFVKTKLERNLGLFVHTGDVSGFYFSSIPGMDVWTAMAFWLGLGLVLARWRRFPEFSLLAWLGLGIIMGGMATLDSPSANRLLIATPPVFLTAGIFAQRAWERAAGYFASRPRILTTLALSGAAGLVLITNFYIYFDDYARKAPNWGISVARELAREPEKYHAYLMGDPVIYAGFGTIRFVAQGADVQNLKPQDGLPRFQPDGKGIALLALPWYLDSFREFQELYPGGLETQTYDQTGRLNFYTYRVMPEPIE